jgi:hypothetical protein
MKHCKHDAAAPRMYDYIKAKADDGDAYAQDIIAKAEGRG